MYWGKNMGLNLDFLQDMGLDTQEGISFTGNPEKYISAIVRFYGNYEKNRDKVNEYLGAGDIENYMITVHALKSNAKMIGAMELSKRFEALETAARNGDKAVMDNDTPATMDAYKKLIDSLEPLGAIGDVKAADEISGDEARDLSDKLLEALDEFDDELSKELIAKLEGYPFRITQMEKLKQAKACINDFLYDDAADLIKEIMPAIE